MIQNSGMKYISGIISYHKTEKNAVDLIREKEKKKYSYSTFYPLLPKLSGDPLFKISGIVSYSANRKYHIILYQTV